TDAQRRLTALKMTRGETEVGLQLVARNMGYRDHVDLLREWSEYLRLLDDSAPALRAQQSLTALEQRRQQAVDEAQTLLARSGGGGADPDQLEPVAAGIRRARAVIRRAGEVEQRFAWVEEERRVGEAAAAGFLERATRLLESAGLTWDATRP